MKTRSATPTPRNLAFTLMELLVVIAIIGILAALLFPAGAVIKDKATRSRAHTELEFVASAINNYKAQLGHYPPDNSADTNTWVSQLFYELHGTIFTNGVYQLENGEGAIKVADFGSFYSTPLKVGGFVNATKGGGEESPVAKNFLIGLKPAQYLLVRHNGVDALVLGNSLGSPQKGDVMLTNAAGDVFLNPYRYRVSGPNRNNSGGFDLWVDIVIRGKTNRISNWNKGYDIVP